MTARLTRTVPGPAPQSSGLEIDDDGRVTGWQTSGHRVGRFARELSAPERAALERALASARSADAPPAPGGVTRPGAAIEQLTADGLPDLVLDPNGTPPAGWDDLVGLLLSVREDLADSPVAAVELEVAGSPLGVRLRQVGPQPLAVRMATLTVQATLFDRDSALLNSVTHTVDGSGATGQVGPGWELRLADDLGLAAVPPGGFLTVTVGPSELDVRGDGVLRRAEFGWITE